MNQVSFDTHAAMRRLGQAGASTPLAEAVVDIVTEATSLNMQMVEDLAYVKSQIETNMATKADIESLRADLFRALWIQGGVLAGLILALAGVMLGFAGVVLTGS